MRFITSHLRVAFEITGEKLQRTEIFDYPRDALRELLFNAIIHRDYMSPTDVQIKIFDQSILFFNPGKLYGGLTVEELNTDNYQARTRNKLIAEAFYLTCDTEKYGSGFRRIRNAIAEYPTMQFTYRESGDGFITELHYNEQKIVTTAKHEGLPPPITPPITEAEIRLLRLVKEHPEYSSSMLAKELSIGRDTVKEYLARLKKKGVLAREGSLRSGRWVVVGNRLSAG